jgi:hypothetical protein
MWLEALYFLVNTMMFGVAFMIVATVLSGIARGIIRGWQQQEKQSEGTSSKHPQPAQGIN